METPQGKEGRSNQSLFSERVRKTIEFMQVMEFAEEEARSLNQHSIGIDLLLLGLMQNPLIKETLSKFDFEEDQVRKHMEFVYGAHERLPTNREIRLSPRAKRVIEIAAARGRFLFPVETPLIDLLVVIIEDEERPAILPISLTEDVNQVKSKYILLKKEKQEWKLPEK